MRRLHSPVIGTMLFAVIGQILVALGLPFGMPLTVVFEPSIQVSAGMWQWWVAMLVIIVILERA
jgi:hypothetical protein